MFTLNAPGAPASDVICKHGRAVDRINKYDYALNVQTARVTESDLAEWVSNVDWFAVGMECQHCSAEIYN